jgi:hypothetical protein
MQSSRESTATQMQSSSQSAQASRQSTASSTVSNTQTNYYGGSGCYNCAHWDSGDAAAGFVAGAIVGGAVVAASQPKTTTVVVAAPAPVAPPCNVYPVPVGGTPYYHCGATWYTAGYASTGVVYMPVPPPPGY